MYPEKTSLHLHTLYWQPSTLGGMKFNLKRHEFIYKSALLWKQDTLEC